MRIVRDSSISSMKDFENPLSVLFSNQSIYAKQSFDENGNMINIYDRTLDEVANYKYYCMLSNNVEIITNIEPYENYINKYGKNYINNFREENKDV